MSNGAGAPKRILSTVLFTDIVGSTKLAAEHGDRGWREIIRAHHAFVRKALRHFGGREIDTAGDGFFATFAQPADAIRCATALGEGLRAIGLEIRVGIHTGEVEVIGSKVGGIAVHIGARVAAKAAPGEVLVSGTVREVVSGAGIVFEDRGQHELKGVPGEWRLFAVAGGTGLGLPPALAGAVPRIRAPAKARATRLRRRALLGGGLTALVAAAAVAAVVVHGVLLPPVLPGANTAALFDTASGKFKLAVGVGRSPVGVAVSTETAWVINEKDRTVEGLDATSGTVRDQGLSVGGTPAGVAFGANYVWVAVSYGVSSAHGAYVVRVDPVTDQVDEQISVGDGAQGITVGPGQNGSVWVTDPVSDDVIKIDSQTGASSTPIPVGGEPEAIAVSADAVWVANTLDESLWRLDPLTGAVVAKISLPIHPTAVAVSSDSVWVASLTGNKVIRIDPTTNTTLDEITVPAGPAALALGDGALWVACVRADEVVRVDPRSDKVSDHVSTAGAPDGLAWGPAGLWVTVGSGST